MPPPNSKERAPSVVRTTTGISLTREQFGKHLESLRNKRGKGTYGAEFREKMVALAEREKESREIEIARADIMLKQSLADVPDEKGILTEEEAQTREDIVKEYIKLEDTEGSEKVVRYQIFEHIFTQEGFKGNYAKWKQEYADKKAAEPELEITEEEYILEEGLKYIKENRELIIKSRVSHKLDKLDIKKDEEPDEESGKNREEITKQVLAFTEAREELLLRYSSLEKPEQNKLYDEFADIFLENGYPDEKKESFRALFMEIIGDSEYAVISGTKLGAMNSFMIDMIKTGVTAEDWDQMLQKKWDAYLNKEFQEKEVVEEKKDDYVAPPTAIVGEVFVPYESVQDIAHRYNVHLERDPNDPNMYTMVFPNLKEGPKKSAKMRIEYDKEFPEDLNKAKFRIQDEDSDIGSGTVGSIGTQRAREYSAADLATQIPRIQFDMVLRKAAKDSTDPDIKPDYINRVIKDPDLIYIAERIFGFKLGDRPIGRNHIKQLSNFLTIILRKEGGKSFTVMTLRNVRNVLNNEDKAAEIRKIVKSKGQIVKSFSDLMEQVDIEENKKKKEGK